MKTGNIADRDKTARYENDAGEVTTFYRLMMAKKGGATVGKAEDVQAHGVCAYRYEGELFRPVHPEWIAEVRESDLTYAEIAEREDAGKAEPALTP